MKRARTTGLLLLALTALPATPAGARLNVVATTEHLAGIARTVGGDRIDVTYLARGAEDPHAVQPKPSFAARLNRADLLIVNGQGLEAAWLPSVIAASTNSRVQERKPGYLDASAGASLITYDPSELHVPVLFNAVLAINTLFAKRGQEVALGNNHHYWLDPANGDAIGKAIAERLALLDPRNADLYRANFVRFSDGLPGRLAEWDALMKPFEGTGIVAYHRSWTYLARRHGLKVVGYVEPREPIVLGPTNLYNPPDRAERDALVTLMAERRVRLVLTERYQDLRLADEIAGRAGARLLVLPSSISASEGIDDYVQLFDHIYRELVRALERSGG